MKQGRKEDRQAKLLRMVNFMYQVEWGIGYPDIWFSIISGCICLVFLDET